jgi:hypothetical protein
MRLRAGEHSTLATVQGHRDECAGQWVALDGDTLVAHGNDGSDVTQRAWEQGVAEPLVVCIPGEPELPFGGW